MGAARVSAGDVKEIINTDIDDTVITANFIDTAHAYVEAHLPLSVCSTNTEAILTKIEMYMAAHLISLSNSSTGGSGGGAIKYQKIGDASEAYDTSTLSDGLRSTRYGEMAIMLDTCGVLAEVASPKLSAQFEVV